MARPLRVEYEGAIYHVMSRGDRLQRIYRNHSDAELFLKTLDQACVKADWLVHAYCLMRNHFHLVLETPNANLISGMKWLLGTYTSRFNCRHNLIGHLFSGRYKSIIVDGDGGEYLRAVCQYVHLNPVRAKLLRESEPLKNYRWSSFPFFLRPISQRPVWLRAERVFGDLGIRDQSGRSRRRFETAMEERRSADDPESYRNFERGWYLGERRFGKALREKMVERIGVKNYGDIRRETREVKAERIVEEELARIGWEAGDLKTSKKGAVEKVRIAGRLRSETTVTLAWICQKLCMGSVHYLNNRLYLWRHDRL